MEKGGFVYWLMMALFWLAVATVVTRIERAIDRQTATCVGALVETGE